MERTVKSPAVWIDQQIEARKAQLQAERARERRKTDKFTLHGSTTITTYRVQIGTAHYEVVRDHAPLRDDEEWKVYGLRHGYKYWLMQGNEMTATGKRVLKKLKEALAEQYNGEPKP
jgi:hypothetical protein